MSTPRYPWTEEEIKILKKMSKEGRTLDEIGLVLKSRSLDGIRHKASDLGIIVKGWEPEIDYDLLKEMVSIEEI
jgi:hypothetical protein